MHASAIASKSDDREQVFSVQHSLLDMPVHLVQRLVPVLLHADGLALVVASAEGLQGQLDLLHAHTEKWQLTVNINKIKAVVFKHSCFSTNFLLVIHSGPNRIGCSCAWWPQSLQRMILYNVLLIILIVS